MARAHTERTEKLLEKIREQLQPKENFLLNSLLRYQRLELDLFTTDLP